MRKVDRRTKVILSTAAAAAVVANAGAAWAYWRVTGSGTGTAVAGSAIELRLTGRSDADKPLYPGGTSDLTITVTNDNNFPIKILKVSAVGSRTAADDAHARGGCRTTGVVVASDMQVSWDVPKNSIGVFSVRDGLKMTNQSDTACQGAVFTIAVQATGVSAAS